MAQLGRDAGWNLEGVRGRLNFRLRGFVEESCLQRRFRRDGANLGWSIGTVIDMRPLSPNQ